MTLSIRSHLLCFISLLVSILLISTMTHARTEGEVETQIMAAGGTFKRNKDGAISQVSLLVTTDEKMQAVEFKSLLGLASLSIGGI